MSRLIVSMLMLFSVSAINAQEAAERLTIDAIRDTMERVLPDVIKFDAGANDDVFKIFMSDKLGEYTPTEVYILDSVPTIFFYESVLAIGKFMDNTCFAIICDGDSDVVEFYRLHNNTWKRIGGGKMGIPSSFITFEKLIDAPNPIISLKSAPNMNGNSWSELYMYDAARDEIKFAGNLCTSYTVNLREGTIDERYEGSWYLPVHVKQYKWIDGFLVPMRKTSVRFLEEEERRSIEQIISHYENLTGEPDGLELIFEERYDKKKEKHKKYWSDDVRF